MSQKDIIKAYGREGYKAAQLCTPEGWIKWHEYIDSFPQSYDVKTIKGIDYYRPKTLRK
jgi:hypothetical protein